MGNIVKMSAHLANMIAAGEVVERPTSVVKELVENAIDAKASSVKVILKNGGIDEIKIIDDGVGMDSDDVLMSFVPHATSKIKTEYDLFRINTLGFRGEAVASIAAVSNMQIISSQNGNDGYQVTYRFGSLESSGVTHSNKGTTVIVSNLFYNTPARLKYLKPAKTELASISYLLDRIAISHPDVRISLINDGKELLHTSASSSSSRLMGEVYGVEVAKNLLETEYNDDGYNAKILLAKPNIYRSNKLEITLICNNRFVKSYDITTTVIESFQTYLPIGKYPIAVIYLDVDPLLIDVNVHPSKTEIKISNIESICQRLKEEIKKLLKSTELIYERQIETPTPQKEQYQKASIFDMLGGKETKLEEKPFTYNESKTNVNYEYQAKDTYVSDGTANDTFIEVVEEKVEDTKKNTKIPYMEYVGTIFGTYLIFQNSDGMYLMDQHAAAERVNYEKYYKILGDENQPRTDLLIPIALEFTKSEAMYILNNLDKFEKVGFTLDQAGERDFILRSVPLWAKLDDIANIIYDILSQMINNKDVSVIRFRDYIAKQISCKSSIKANHKINRLEIDALIDNLNKCENPYTCPHGRPTMIKLTLSDIERMFERIQK
jgi:DNA mismatch repair protein MutL